MEMCTFFCVYLQYGTISTYFRLSCFTFLTHLHISSSFVTLVLKLSAWCEREERAREMRDGGKKLSVWHLVTESFPHMHFHSGVSWWLVLTLTAQCNIPPLSSHCQAISSGCLLFCLRLFYRCASRLGLDPFTYGLISSLCLRSSSYSWHDLTSAVKNFSSRFLTRPWTSHTEVLCKPCEHLIYHKQGERNPLKLTTN